MTTNMTNWNPNDFFFLTRTPTVEITTVGGNYGDVDIHEKGSLFWFGNQHITPVPVPDRWGRNSIDQTFIALCIKIYYFVYLYPYPNKKAFYSLTARKDGDQYMVRVRYDDVDLEMEVVEAFNYFTEKLKEK